MKEHSHRTNKQMLKTVSSWYYSVAPTLHPSCPASRSVEAALRRSIPAFNKDVKTRMEDVSFKLRIPQRKPWQGMTDNVQASLALAQQADQVLTSAAHVLLRMPGHDGLRCVQSKSAQTLPMHAFLEHSVAACFAKLAI